MNTSIQISSSAVESAPRTARGEVVKLVQGALLVAVAAVAAAGTASVAAPFCVWKGEVALFLNESFHAAFSISAIAEYASAVPGSDWASLLVAALIAAYPAYHAAWRVREGLGLSCEAPVFSGRVSRSLAALSACLLLAMLFMGYGTSWLINGSAMGDQSLVESGHNVWAVSIMIMLGCALMCLFKWFLAKGPGRNFGKRLRYRACPPRRRPAEARELETWCCATWPKLLACLLALTFIAVAYVVVSVAIVLALGAVALAVCLAGIPVILAASWRR